MPERVEQEKKKLKMKMKNWEQKCTKLVFTNLNTRNPLRRFICWTKWYKTYAD